MATYLLTLNGDSFGGTTDGDLFDGYLNGMTGGIDTLGGGGGDDTFALRTGYEDSTFGTFIGGTIDGGSGTGDTVEIHGWHGPGATPRADLGTMVFSNVEVLKIMNSDYVVLHATMAQLLSFGTIANLAAGSEVRLEITTGGTIDFSTRMAANSVSITADSDITSGYSVTGTVFRDYLRGTNFNDTLIGGLGDDSFSVSGGTDSLSGGDGADSFYVYTDPDGGEDPVIAAGTINGGDGTDTVLVNGRLDVTDEYFEGNLGSVAYLNVEILFTPWGRVGGTLTQFASFGSIRGSEEFEQLDIVLRGPSGTIDFSSRIDPGFSAHIHQGGFGGVSGGYNVTGSGGDDWLEGTDFSDTLSGAGGDDEIYGSDGSNSLNGGTGNDTFILFSAPSGAVDGGGDTDKVVADDLGSVTFSNVEILDAVVTGGVWGSTAQIASFASIISTSTPADWQIFFGLRGTGGAIDFTTRVTGLNSVHVYDEGVNSAYIVTGSVNGDLLEGSGYADTLNGGAGNDTLKGHLGFDNLAGGQGNDTYHLDDLATATTEPYDTVVEGVNGGIDTVFVTALHNPSFIVDFYSLPDNVENATALGSIEFELDGNGLNNALTGHDGANTLQGMGGDDTLKGEGGDDAAYGREGNDTIYTSEGADTLNGGEARDTVVFHRAMVADWQSGILDAAIASDSWVDWEVIQGSSGHDRIRTNSWGFQIELRGGAGNDTLHTGIGGVVGDWLYGEAGHDELSGGAGNDTMSGGTGNDTIYGGNDNDSLNGGDDADLLVGHAGIDTVLGGLGNDDLRIFDGEAAAGETYDGGGGNDTLALFGDGDSVFEFRGSAIAGVEQLHFWDTFGGGATAHFRAGQFPFTSILFEPGGTGTRTIAIEMGASTALDLSSVAILGTAGADDRIRILGDDAAESITGSAMTDYLEGNARNDTLDGGGANDTLDGGTGHDWLVGGAGRDRLLGGDQNDTLLGGGATDTLYGGKGNDTYVDPTGDTIVELAGEGTDTVESSQTFSLAALPQIENLTLTGTGAAGGTGNDARNLIVGNTAANALDGGIGNDTLQGGAGADTLTGGEGIDRMEGGLGNDVYYVDLGRDRVVEASGTGTGTDRVYASVNYTLTANVETLYLTGTAGIGKGNQGANLIVGNARHNRLEGGAGNDTLAGGTGNDTLIGGANADVFRFAAANAGADRIEDFNRAGDRFDLSGGSFTNAQTAGGDVILTHDGGTIRMVGMNAEGLTLTQWNALVLSEGGAAAPPAASFVALDDMYDGAAFTRIAVLSADWFHA